METHSKLFEPLSQCLAVASNGRGKMSVKLREASFAIMRGWRFRFIYRLGMPAVSIFLIFSLSYVTNNFGNIYLQRPKALLLPFKMNKMPMKLFRLFRLMEQ